MARSARITKFFGDADYSLALLIGQCEELQELFDCGLDDMRERCAAIRVKDIRAVIRLGLIGGGMDKETAFRLMHRHVVAGELASAAILAVEVVSAAIAGVADEPLGEEAGEGIATLSPEEKSSSRTFTGQEPPLAIPLPKSKRVRSGTSAPRSRGGSKLTAASKPSGHRPQTNTTKS